MRRPVSYPSFLHRPFFRGWLACAALLAAWTVAAVGQAERPTYLVQSGDVLGTIAERTGVSVEELRAWNEISDDHIRIGQRLWLQPNSAQEASKTTGVPQNKAKLLATTSAAADRSADGPTYQVQPGDTLVHIAARFNTTVEALVQANAGLSPDAIRAGQELRLEEGRGGHRIEHAVQEGDVLVQIARRYRVAVDDIIEWNPGLKPDRLRLNQKLTIYSAVPEHRSASIGTPSNGRLDHAVRLPAHPGYFLRDGDRAWGTQETVRAIVGAFDALRRQDPRAPKIRIHDLSLRNGGPISDHRSHQSGRDADITYYQRDCGGQPCPLRHVLPQDLDVARQWRLMEYWLKRGQVEAIFVDYRLQRSLYQHAKSKGASREELLLWFQYPRGPGTPAGVVRHFPNHANHFHVRFACHERDAGCESFRVFPATLANR